MDLVPHFDKSESIAAEIVSGWGAMHEIRASVIRSILCGNLVAPSDVDPRGMMIRGAKISGRLDLAHLECAYPLELTACVLPLGLDAVSASFVRINLEQCVVGTSLTTQHVDAVQGAVRLVGAMVGGQLSLNDAVLSNPAGPALSVDGLAVSGNIFPYGSFQASGRGGYGAVSLAGKKVGYLHVSDKEVLKSSKQCQWVVDGLAYRGYPTNNPEKWLKFLQTNTVGYAAQPYQHLARAVRDAGHDGVARKILMAQRSDQLRRGKPGWKDWCWGAFTWITVGYGYRSWLPLAWFVGILFLVWWAVGACQIVCVTMRATLSLTISRKSPPEAINTLRCSWYSAPRSIKRLMP